MLHASVADALLDVSGLRAVRWPFMYADVSPGVLSDVEVSENGSAHDVCTAMPLACAPVWWGV